MARCQRSTTNAVRYAVPDEIASRYIIKAPHIRDANAKMYVYPIMHYGKSVFSS